MKQNNVFRMLGFFKEMRTRIILTMVVGAASIIVFAFMPTFLSHAFNDLRQWTMFGGDKGDTIFMVVKYLIIFGVLALFNAVFDIFCSFVILKAEMKIRIIKLAEAKRKLDIAPMWFFQKNTMGDISRRVASTTGEIINEFLNTIYTISRAIVFFITTSIMMFMINWILAIVIILSLPLCIITARVVSRFTQIHFKKCAAAASNVYTVVDQKFSMQDFWTLHGLEDNSEEFEKVNHEHEKSLVAEDVSMAVNALYVNFIQNFMNLLVTFLFAVLYITQAVPTDFGVLPAFILYSNRFLANAVVVTTATNVLQGIAARSPRVFEIFDLQDEVSQNETIEIKKIKSEVVFDKVSLVQNEENILRNISFTIPQGKNVAIVGPVGSGKTHIVDMLAKLSAPTTGAIIVDGVNLNEITAKSYYKCIGMAMENPFIFRGSVAENLLYGVRRELPENVMAITEKLGSHEFIEALPNGYETWLSENASLLGHGQKQAICIARLILQNPDIAIFQETLSATDSVIEKSVYEKIMGMNKKQTKIFVTTRLSSIQNCDIIYYMGNGKIVEHGTHKELMSKKGKYYKAYKGE